MSHTILNRYEVGFSRLDQAKLLPPYHVFDREKIVASYWTAEAAHNCVARIARIAWLLRDTQVALKF